MKSPRIERRAAGAGCSSWPAGIHPVLQRVYAARGIVSPSDIAHRLSALPSPSTLGGIDRACELIEDAIRRDLRIIIVGDFDCDGATGTAVAVRGLRALGARDVGYRVPNRFTHGYGLSAGLVEELRAEHPQVLITVDNGVSAHAGVAAAKQLGMAVVVTDHHLPGTTLPNADAIVNPNLNGDLFPSKALAGVGVMFYLLLALRARLRANGWFSERGIAEYDLSKLLDIVALGTVADLVPLDRNNRIFIEAGLKRMRLGQACAGMSALIEVSNRDPKRLVASDLGFALAPRLNAAGRLDDMQLGIECLITDDPSRARSLAEMLSTMNAERRELQGAMVDQAEMAVKKWISDHGESGLPIGVVLFEPDWHHGVVGLVASRLKEILQRPVIACAPSSDNSGEIKASGRSISGFHLRDALAEVDTRRPGLIQRFGGHAMAAGLSLHRSDLEHFSATFDAVARERISPHQLEAVLLTDGELSSADFTIELAQQLRYGGPWGQAFPEPLFDGEFALDSWRIVGENHWRLKLRCDGMQRLVDAIFFNAPIGKSPPQSMRAAFQLEVDEWSGTQTLRLLLRYIAPWI